MILIYTIILTPALYLALARARITAGFRKLLPFPVERFLDCAMCAGAWYGLAVSIVALVLGYHYPALEDHHAPFVCFLGAAVWTPIISALVGFAMDQLGTSQRVLDGLIARGEIQAEPIPDEES